MNYRLIKSEPYKYSREQFCVDKKTMRDGVRNFQARNNLKSMKKWDLCFRYHSNEWKEIVGIAEVVKEAYPDPTALWPDGEPEKWDRVVVDVKPYKKLKTPITLEDIKADKNLATISLLKQQRLSVAPITKKEWEYIVKLGGE